MVMMTPTDVPKEISQIMVQLSQGVKSAIPGASVKEYELQKIAITLTSEELEAFQLKPYPNQIYEVIITEGNLNFKNV